jgi:hypothetical protein
VQRSWLEIGSAVYRGDAKPGFDIVILTRGKNAPGLDIINAPGHVGFYAGDGKIWYDHANDIRILGGNQGDTVSIKEYNSDRILGIRRLN